LGSASRRTIIRDVVTRLAVIIWAIPVYRGGEP
jgi:hypothetical protein